MSEPVTRFTLNDGSVAHFLIPWSASDAELQMIEELVGLQIQQIHRYREKVSKREEWWIKNRHLAP